MKREISVLDDQERLGWRTLGFDLAHTATACLYMTCSQVFHHHPADLDAKLYYFSPASGYSEVPLADQRGFASNRDQLVILSGDQLDWAKENDVRPPIAGGWEGTPETTPVHCVNQRLDDYDRYARDHPEWSSVPLGQFFQPEEGYYEGEYDESYQNYYCYDPEAVGSEEGGEQRLFEEEEEEGSSADPSPISSRGKMSEGGGGWGSSTTAASPTTSYDSYDPAVGVEEEREEVADTSSVWPEGGRGSLSTSTESVGSVKRSGSKRVKREKQLVGERVEGEKKEVHVSAPKEATMVIECYRSVARSKTDSDLFYSAQYLASTALRRPETPACPTILPRKKVVVPLPSFSSSLPSSSNTTSARARGLTTAPPSRPSNKKSEELLRTAKEASVVSPTSLTFADVRDKSDDRSLNDRLLSAVGRKALSRSVSTSALKSGKGAEGGRRPLGAINELE
ncbi:putative short-chain dehydrogenase/reductase [Pseudohyphozyma bogoriensis]|nr:putative short-chain dehydrogenase/reductase [Pseudohyphozyma bogoriensis]